MTKTVYYYIIVLTYFTLLGCNGDRYAYHENGQIEVVVPYNDGRIHGVKKRFYENGQLERQIMYHHGVKGGLFEEYYENGKPKNIGTVNSENVFTGNRYEYHDNGAIHRDQEIINDKYVRYKVYDEDGIIIKSAFIQFQNEYIGIQTNSDTVALGEDYSISVIVTDEFFKSNGTITFGSLDSDNQIIKKHGSIEIKGNTTTIIRPASKMGMKYTEGIVSANEVKIPFRVGVYIKNFALEEQ